MSRAIAAHRVGGRDAGSASLWLLALVACVALAVTAVLGVAGAVAARHRAAGAADLAALAAAERLGSGDAHPCAAAARIAAANGAHLESCDITAGAVGPGVTGPGSASPGVTGPGVVEVRVSVRAQGVAGALARLSGARPVGRARAAPG